jgi:predicted phosphohydrolase
MKLTWLTDIHCNFISQYAAKEFAKTISSDIVIITGDIAEANSFADCINDFKNNYSGQLYFTLGNHDFYRGSFQEVETLAKQFGNSYLTCAAPIRINDNVCLVGHDGWYDCRCGYGEDSRVEMSDFQLIKDFNFAPIHIIADKCRRKADDGSFELKIKINAAIKTGYKKIYVATHYPPFPNACWYKGKISDGHWLPWFTNVSMGQMLAGVAEDNPDVEFVVICGHSHGEGIYKHSHNLIVFTGKANYGEILISKEFEE